MYALHAGEGPVEVSASQSQSPIASDQRQGLVENLPSIEDLKAVPPKEVDLQARVERLKTGSKSVHFPLQSEADDSASESSEAGVDTPKPHQSSLEGKHHSSVRYSTSIDYKTRLQISPD